MRYLVCSVIPVCITYGLVLTILIPCLPISLLAHGILIRAAPPVDARVTERPGQIRLWFNESVEHRFSRVTVHRATRDAATGELQPQERIDAGLSPGPRITQELAVTLPETLTPGLYLVQWKVLSIDSHRTTGKFTLTYDPKAVANPEADKANPNR